MLAGVERLVDLVGPRESGLTGAALAEVEAGGRIALDLGSARGDRRALRRRQPRRPDGPPRPDDRPAAPLLRGQAVSRAVPRRGRPDRPALRVLLRAEDRLAVRPALHADDPGAPPRRDRPGRLPGPQPALSSVLHAAESAQGPGDVRELGDDVRPGGLSRRRATGSPACRTGEPIAVLFSGGVDSGSVFLLARQALRELGRDPGSRPRLHPRPRAAGTTPRRRSTGSARWASKARWERVALEGAPARPRGGDRDDRGLSPARRRMCRRRRCCSSRRSASGTRHCNYLLDGDGGDENLKAYPLEDSDLTISSVLRNPLLYQEGWGIDAIKHSLTLLGRPVAVVHADVRPGESARLRRRSARTRAARRSRRRWRSRSRR